MIWLPNTREMQRRPVKWHTPNADCGCCAPGCTDYEPCGSATCATPGSVGSESGDECTTCDNQIIYDPFSGSQTLNPPPGWSQPGTGLMPCQANPHWRLSGGAADEYGTGSGILRSFARPALAGLCIEVKVKIVSMSTGGVGGVGGITLGLGRLFFARPFNGDYAIHSCITEYGCIGVGSTFTSGVGGVTRADGDTIGFIIRDEGAGDGVCSVCYKINGTTVRVEEGVQFCFPCTMQVGLLTTAGAIKKFDDFEVRTS